MTDTVDTSLLQALLIELRNDVKGLRSTMVAELGDVKARMNSLENQTVQMHKSVAFIHEDLLSVNVRLDRIGGRIEHIERRLDLTDAT